MSYFYEDFEVKENQKSYLVTCQVPGEMDKKVRISKETIEKLKADEDAEMLAILCANVEFARFDARAFGRFTEDTIITGDEFRDRLVLILAVKSIEDVIAEVSEMKYHEIKEYFE